MLVYPYTIIILCMGHLFRTSYSYHELIQEVYVIELILIHTISILCSTYNLHMHPWQLMDIHIRITCLH